MFESDAILTETLDPATVVLRNAADERVECACCVSVPEQVSDLIDAQLVPYETITCIVRRSEIARVAAVLPKVESNGIITVSSALLGLESQHFGVTRIQPDRVVVVIEARRV